MIDLASKIILMMCKRKVYRQKVDKGCEVGGVKLKDAKKETYRLKKKHL